MRLRALLATAAIAPVPTMVVRDSGETVKTVRPSAASVRVSGSRCAVPAATPLAALLAIRVKPHLRDFGSCSKREVDSGSLFVDGIGTQRNRGLDGWVYKVATKLGTAGAADPTGPFGRGRLRASQPLVWFYCRLDAAAKSCQRTLSTRSSVSAGVTRVRVTAYDDRGAGVPAAGAAVSRGGQSTVADASGLASLPAGGGVVTARAQGLVPSFPEEVR